MFFRIDYVTIPVAGKRVRVKIVRDSKWCRWLTKKEFIVLGDAIHYRAPRIRGAMLKQGLASVREKYRIGSWRYYWRLLTSES